MTATGDKYTWDVFISYSHRDSDWVQGWLLPAIEGAGLRACIDCRDFGIGTPSVINMEQAVERSRKTLLVLTPAYIASEWCEFENLMCYTITPANRERRLIPVLHVATELPTRIGMLTYLPMRDSAECKVNLPRLLDALHAEGPLEGDRPPTPPPWPPPICLPPPAGTVPDWFVARPEEADRVLRALGVLGEAGTPGRTVAMTAVHGMGGVGKTTLAAWLLQDERVRRRWPDGVLWATLGPDAKGEAAADAPLLLWGAALGEKGLREYPRTEDKAAILRGLMAGRRVLLVVDDAWDSVPARLLLDCAGPDCGRLLTTRQWEVAAQLDKKPVRVGVMTPDEALALLVERAGEEAMRDVKPEQAEELCARLGYLPLALNLAGAGLLGGTPVGEYLQALRAEQGLDLLKLEEGKTREQSVGVCLGISLKRLTDEERQRYALLGVLAPGAPFGAMEAAIVWADGPDTSFLSTELRGPIARMRWEQTIQRLESEPDPAIPRLLRRLAHHALLDTLDGDGAARYRQHALLREHAVGLLYPAERRTAEQRHAAGFLALAQQHHKQQSWLAFDPFHPQALAALERAKQACEDDALPAEARDAARRLISDYAFALRDYWPVRGLFVQERLWKEMAVECCHALGRRGDEGAHLGNLGLAYWSLGEVKRAIDYYEQALAIRREIGDRRGEGNDLGNLGNAYADLGEARRAIGYHEQALAIRREIGDRRGEGNDLGNLGIAYYRLGEARRAIEYYEQASAIRREIGDRRGEGNDLGNLGLAYADLGDARRAIEYHEQALVIAREIGDRRGEGADLGNLGIAYYRLGEVRRAIEYYEQALAIRREIGDRRGEGNDHFNLGLALKGEGDLAGAREQFAAALALYEAIGSPYAEKARRALAALEE